MKQKTRSVLSNRKLSFLRIWGFHLFASFFTILFVLQAQAADFNIGCSSAELITAITTANGNVEADTINLPVGCTITLNAIDNINDGSNGLPSISSEITINGNGGTIQRSAGAADSFRIFHIAGGGDLTFNNVTIQNGLTPGAEGAGIYNLGTLTINDSTITNNENQGYGGGGIYNEGETVNITRSTISYNTVGDSLGGGGIRHYEGTMTIVDSTISNNEAGYGGGGINVNRGDGVLILSQSTVIDNTGDSGGISGNYMDGGSITITNSSITNNSSDYSGGGISLSNCGADFVLIEFTTISGNTAVNGGGGGISHNIDEDSPPPFPLTPLTIDNCIISNNSTEKSGGGIVSKTNGSGQLTISNSTFSGNTAISAGGAFHTNSLYSITATTFFGNSSSGGGGGAINFLDSFANGDVTNCTFADNIAGVSGGGIRNAGTTNFLNCTFSGNSAPNGVGGGVYDDGGTTDIQNTIVAGSPSGGNCSGTINDLDSNLCDDGTCGFSGDNTDPLLDPSGLQDNGGPTLTIALSSGSPAIDGVSDCAGLSVDQRGMLRPVGAACDIGAFEVQAEIPPAQPIPTISEWGMIFMSLILAGSALWMIRRRKIL